MIWFSFALFAIGFVLTALFAQRPDFENARAEELDPNNFPRATEDDPVPLLFGCARIKGPNTLWYGDYEAVPITKKQKTSIFSSTTVTIGHTYFLTLDLGLCLGEAALKQIFIDSVAVEAGIIPTFGEIGELYVNAGTGITQWSVGNITQNEFDDQAFTQLWSSQQGSAFTTLNVVEDLGLQEITIDGGETTFSGSYELEFLYNAFGGSTSGPGQLAVVFYPQIDAGGAALGSENVSVGVDSVEVPNTGFEEIALENIPIPVGTRSIRIEANFAPSSLLFTAAQTRNTRVSIGGKVFTYSEASYDIVEPELFGGEEQGGGWVGNVQFYPGTFDQNVDSNLESSLGSGNVPAYRGTSHLVMVKNNIGESPALRKMEFLMGSYTDYLENGIGGVASNSNTADAGPAEVLYRVCHDDWSGMDFPASLLNIDSFKTAGLTLLGENHGVSGVVSTPQEGKKVTREILRQIDGVFTENASGEIELILIRDDYDAGTLPIYDEDDIINLVSYQVTSWEDVISEVRVSYSNRDSESSKVAMEQNAATLSMIGRKSTEISFPFCYSSSTAQELAARELSRLSVPIVKVTAEFNRNGFGLRTGDVIKITFPELGISELIMRVQKVNIGRLDNNRVRVDMVQDIFAAATQTFSVPVDTGWTDNRPVPVTIPTTEVVEMPYFFSSNLGFPIADGNVGVIPFALRPQGLSTGFTFNWDTISGLLEFQDPQSVLYPYNAQIVLNLAETDGFETGIVASMDVTLVTGGIDDTLSSSSAAAISNGESGLLYMDDEWMAYETATDNMDGTWTLTNVYRGLLGTTPKRHLANSNIWFMDNSLLGEGFISGELFENDTLFHVFLDQVGAVTRSSVSEVETSTLVTDLANRPLRPRNLQADASRAVVPYDAGGDPTFDLTWVASNRAENKVSFETDAAEVPDISETYDLEVWVDGVEDGGLAQTGVTSPLAIDLSSASGSSGEIRLYSRRTTGDLRRSAYYAFFPFTLGLTADTTEFTADTTIITADQT